MKLDNYCNLDFSDYWPHLYCYYHNFSTELSLTFFWCLMSNWTICLNYRNWLFQFYSDYWPHLYCNNHKFSAGMSLAFFWCFISNWTLCLNYRSWLFQFHELWPGRSVKYSLLFLPVVGIEPATSRWFHLEALSQSKHLIHGAISPCRIIQSEFLGLIKPLSPLTHGILLTTLISVAQSAGTCRIHRLHPCRSSRAPTSVLDRALKNLMVRFQQGWNFAECWVPFIAIAPRSTLARSGSTW